MIIDWEKAYTAKASSFAAATRSVSSAHESGGSTLRGLPTLSILSVAIAFFPKCPVCWAAYLSVFGIAGLEQLPYSPWLLPLLASLMLINLGSLRLQQRSPQGPAGFYLAAMGAFLILVCGIGLELPYASAAGIILTVMGSAISVLGSRNRPVFNDRKLTKSSPAANPQSQSIVGRALPAIHRSGGQSPRHCLRQQLLIHSPAGSGGTWPLEVNNHSFFPQIRLPYGKITGCEPLSQLVSHYHIYECAAGF